MYDSLVLGGTFDHFHAGHEKLLKLALSLSSHVLLGLTMPEMNQTKLFGAVLLSYEERKREIESFLNSVGRHASVKIIPITDVYGTTREDANLEAIVVTSDTLVGAQKINSARMLIGKNELKVHVCDLVTDSQGAVLSSTRIRQGKVDRLGFVYEDLFVKTIVIPPALKEELHAPIGETYLSWPEEFTQTEDRLVLVGDVVTQTALEKNIPFASAWIDGKSERQVYTFSITNAVKLVDTKLTNAAGTINSQLAAYFGEHLDRLNVVYKIEGEEDLLALVAILLSPLGTRVIFGNPFGQKGICVVPVSEEKKAEIRGLLGGLLVK